MTDTIFQVEPGGRLRGRLRVAGDKSISHRAVMLGALAEGSSEIDGFLEGADCLATRRAFEAMGVTIEHQGPGRMRIQGVGRHGLQAPTAPLDMGNAGTAMRLLAGLLAGQRFSSTLIGDASLSRRPMRRVTDPLALMGARIDTTETGTAPLRIHGGQPLHGIDYPLPVASAQIKSCLLLAGLYADGEIVRITEPAPTRDHTERMLTTFGYPVDQSGAAVTLEGGGRLTATRLTVPADISSAAFFLVGASIAEDSELLLEGVGINPTRTGIISLLQLMGADITLDNERLAGREPVADIRVRSAPLHGIRIPEDQVPLAIDEFPALFIAAACAEGETVLTGAAELRVKESDRIQVMADGLRTLGINAEPTADGIVIQGDPQGAALHGATVDSHGDHRIAMAFAMAGLRAEQAIRIRDCANVATSFPDFAELAQRAGLHLEVLRT